ncbi:MAG: response regulator [Bryobacteraceae bacterium]
MLPDHNTKRTLEAADELSALKGSFLASLNHEIRTPLSGILGMTDLLLETPLDADQRDYVQATRLCAESLFETLNATLEYSALMAGNCVLDESEYLLSEVIEAAVASQRNKAEAKDIAINWTIADNVPETLIGDAVRIRQLLGHLVANAVKFTNRGTVTVRAIADRDAESPHLTIYVRDTGIGIAQENLELIFESFRGGGSGGSLSSGNEGLGLGLAVAQKLSAIMNGHLEVSSLIGEGSEFKILLPLRVPEHVTSGFAAPAGDTSVLKRILVVEDNPVGQTVIRHMLARRNFEVECVDSGALAIAAARTGVFDLILMDLKLPDMNGLEVTDAIRAQADSRQVPILALTANTSDELREVCREHGMQAYLSKPVQIVDLLAAMNRFLS